MRSPEGARRVRSNETNDSGGTASVARLDRARRGGCRARSGGMSARGTSFNLRIRPVRDATTVSTLTEYRDVVASISECKRRQRALVVGDRRDADRHEGHHRSLRPRRTRAGPRLHDDCSYIPRFIWAARTPRTRNEPHYGPPSPHHAGIVAGIVCRPFEGFLRADSGGRSFFAGTLWAHSPMPHSALAAAPKPI